MRFDIISLLPEILEKPLSVGVIGQAIKSGKLDVVFHNPREFTTDVHKTVDDRPYGGGDGMVMLPGPLTQSMEKACRYPARRRLRVYMSPHGIKLDQNLAKELLSFDQIVLVCGRYGGVDQRFINRHIDREISVGDYVLSGGELAALTVIDVVGRLVPGVLGNADSVKEESFEEDLLEYPQFTRPPDYEGSGIPSVLLSGNHTQIREWRRQVSALRTFVLRPDLFQRSGLPLKDWEAAKALYAGMSIDERRHLGLPPDSLGEDPMTGGPV